jgi:hypothetical protein
LSKYEVILTIRSRVWTRAAHSRTNLVIFESIVTSQWQSEPEFDDFFPQLSILLTWDIILPKFDVILTSRSPRIPPMSVLSENQVFGIGPPTQGDKVW